MPCPKTDAWRPEPQKRQVARGFLSLVHQVPNQPTKINQAPRQLTTKKHVHLHLSSNRISPPYKVLRENKPAPLVARFVSTLLGSPISSADTPSHFYHTTSSPLPITKHPNMANDEYDVSLHILLLQKLLCILIISSLGPLVPLQRYQSAPSSCLEPHDDAPHELLRQRIYS